MEMSITWLVAVPDKLLVADLCGLLEGDRLVLDVAVLDKVLVALLLLLRLVVGGVGGVAPLIVAVVALDLLVVLKLLHHHDLLHAPLASSSDLAQVGGARVVRLPIIVLTGKTRSDWGKNRFYYLFH